MSSKLHHKVSRLGQSTNIYQTGTKKLGRFGQWLLFIFEAGWVKKKTTGKISTFFKFTVHDQHLQF